MPLTARTALGSTAAAVTAAVAAVTLALVGCTSTEQRTTSPTSARSGAVSSAPTPIPTELTPDTIRSVPPSAVFPGGLALEPDSLAARAATRLEAEADAGADDAGTDDDGHDDTAAEEARAASEIAERPVAMWIGDGHTDAELTDEITDYLDAAEEQGRTAVFVTYAIPDRDCGNYSAGGLTAERYPAWNRLIADTLEGHDAVVMIEPDSLGMLSRCPQLAEARLPLIEEAVDDFADAGIPAYLDGGNSNWVPPREMASRLESAGIDRARGFYTNVASFHRVDDERAYAEEVSALTGDSRFVIDVSRNGRGWQGTWCNPDGAGLGQDPHVAGGTGGLDALLWVKTPGISDGTCNGGPAAGEWYPSYAAGLVSRRAH